MNTVNHQQYPATNDQSQSEAHLSNGLRTTDNRPEMKKETIMNTRTSSIFSLLATFAIVILMAGSAHAVNQYWDTNGTASGFGTASGTWGTDAFWNTDNSGGAGTFSVTPAGGTADNRFFGNGSNGLGAGTITVSGTVDSGSMTFDDNSGDIEVTGGQINVYRPTITVNNATDTISANFVGNPGNTAYGLTKNGAGILILTGDNSAYISGSYSRTTITDGVLKIDSANALTPGLFSFKNGGGGVLGLTSDLTRTNVGYSPNSGNSIQWSGGTGGGFAAYGGDRTVTITDANNGSTVNFSGESISKLILGHATADSMVTWASGLNLGGAAAVIVVGDGAAAIDGTISGVISDSVGGGSLTKTGAGTLALTGTNTYTGATVVDAGTLLINGDNSAAIGPVTVNNDATLGGSGIIGGDVIVNGTATLSGSSTILGAVTLNSNATFSPGDSPGQLTAASLTLGATTTTIMELGGTTLGTSYDNVTINADGTLTYGGDLSVVDYLAYDMDVLSATYDLFDFSGTTDPTGSSFGTVTVNGISLANNAGLWTGVNGKTTYSFAQATGDLDIVYIPEPSTIILAGLGLAGLTLRRRRR